MIKPWRWVVRSVASRLTIGGGKWELLDGRGRERVTIWQNSDDRFTWHTWDHRGTGGENSECSSLRDAKDQGVAAIVRQGWAPGGWTVSW